MENQGRVYTEEERMILAAQANPQKFSALYEKHYASVLKFVYQRVVTKDDAYDITQQVFLQAMLALHKYELRGFAFSSWLFRIAINETNQLFRKCEKQRGVNYSEEILQHVLEEMNETESEEKEQAVLNTMTGLDDEDFQLVEMRFFEKRSFKEIAEILNINEASAKMRLYRILEKMKPELEKKLKQL